MSWIWYTLKKGSDGSETSEGDDFATIQESLRSEWCKARAQARRSREELQLVEEEMRRGIEFCHWKAQWWNQQIGQRDGIPLYLEEGLKAYAREHSEEETERAIVWAQAWAPICERAKVILRYLSDPRYNAVLPTLTPLEVEIGREDDLIEVSDAEEDFD
ncbi:hypothetical protein AAF712_003195 [Marasmius tenuissimus]|uniref:Uncharacterized protein n=1 Tax=Marasmius tenuissimus TaxID=585030 RepID=A0ABR3AAG7_9AGAR